MAELEISNAALKIEKTKFTMFSQEVDEFLKRKQIRSVVLFGVEVNSFYYFRAFLFRKILKPFV